MYRGALQEKGIAVPAKFLEVRITVQGGIGTANEDRFLREYHGVDGTGWGSPFLLVPEATNVDDETRKKLAAAQKSDFYLSDVSPLGIPFIISGQFQRMERRRSIEAGNQEVLHKKILSRIRSLRTTHLSESMQYQRSDQADQVQPLALELHDRDNAVK